MPAAFPPSREFFLSYLIAVRVVELEGMIALPPNETRTRNPV
ncbi:MAG TPA: hypothetical protein VN894_06195 [Polyangiaceae bacterium]|nr:hypothetical protein [Polyangiaceae bacterium]